MTPVTIAIPNRVSQALLALRRPDEDVDALVLRLTASARGSGFYDAPSAARAERAGSGAADDQDVELALSSEAHDALLALAPYGLSPDRVHDTFNGFMHTAVDDQGYAPAE